MWTTKCPGEEVLICSSEYFISNSLSSKGVAIERGELSLLYITQEVNHPTVSIKETLFK